MILTSSDLVFYATKLTNILSKETGIEEFSTVGSTVKYYISYVNKEKNAREAFNRNPPAPNAAFDAARFRTEQLEEGLGNLSPEEKHEKISLRKKALEIGLVLYKNEVSRELSKTFEDEEKIKSDPLTLYAYIANKENCSVKNLFQYYAKVKALNNLEDIPVKKWGFHKKKAQTAVEDSKNLLDKYKETDNLITENGFSILDEVNKVKKFSMDYAKKMITCKEYVLSQVKTDEDVLKTIDYLRIISNNSKNRNKDVVLNEEFKNIAGRRDFKKLDFSSIEPFYAVQ
ncbi:Uncharacterised protein [Candidatus Tiddalikarchaeum anstoanum]|nr:Uncharacterised protein [Candidatus Tiddalikarchaeum anstoanum]